MNLINFRKIVFDITDNSIKNYGKFLFLLQNVEKLKVSANMVDIGRVFINVDIPCFEMILQAIDFAIQISPFSTLQRGCISHPEFFRTSLGRFSCFSPFFKKMENLDKNSNCWKYLK